MHDLVKNLMTEEEFNTLSEDTRNTIEDEARKAEKLGYLDWHHLTHYVNFTEDEIRKFVDRIDWDYAPTFQHNVNEEVIEAVLASSKKDEFNWHGALVNVKMSEDFIEKHDADITKANKWELVAYYQNLSEKFIEKYADKLNWNLISQKQHLSRKFMIKHFDKLNKFWLQRFQKNWDESIEQEYNFIKTMNDPNILAEMEAVFTKYGYDYNILNAMKNALK